MGNLVHIERFYSDELSERANDFINNHRVEWSNFIVKVKMAIRERSQDKLDAAIETIAYFIDDEGGEELWEELWNWVVRNNRARRQPEE